MISPRSSSVSLFASAGCSSEDTEFIRAYASSHKEMVNLQLYNSAPGITPNSLVNPGDTTSGKFDKYKTFVTVQSSSVKNEV